MDIFGQKLMQLVTDARGIVIAVTAAALLINGIMMVWPDEQIKAAGKRAIPWVAIGCAVALMAVSIANSLGSSF